MKACRPPEQDPKMPTLPSWLDWARIHFTAASVSPTIWASGYAAVGAHFGGDIVWAALAGTLIEVSANCEIAVMCEPTRRLNVELAPARQMVDKHDARKDARTSWLGRISGNRGSLVTFDGHVPAGHASVEHQFPP